MRVMGGRILLLLAIWCNSTKPLPDESPRVTLQDIPFQLIFGAEKQKTAVIVYEKVHEHLATVLRRMLDEHMFLICYEYRSFLMFLEVQIKQILELPSLTSLRSNLRFILICGMECTVSVMDFVTELDYSFGQRSVFRHFSNWVIFFPESLPDLNITLDHVTLIRMHKDMRQNESVEAYTLLWMPGGREWSRVHVLDLSDTQVYPAFFPNTLRGLNGRKLTLSLLEWLPYAERQNNTGQINYVGASVDILNHLVASFNFSYEIAEPPDGLWGQETSNGSWNGILGMIQRVEVDMCPVPFGITHGRKKIIDFSASITDTAHSAIYKRLSDNAYPWLYLFSSFSWQVYSCAVASLMWIVLLVFFMQKLKREENLSSCFGIVVPIPLRQEIQQTPRHSSKRTVVFTWSLFCLVMTAVYSSNLVSVMAVRKQNIPFNSLRELTEQDEYTVGLLKGTYAEDVLKNSNDSTYKILNNKYKFVKASGVEMFAVALKKIMEENVVLLLQNPTVRLLQSQTCDLVEMKEKMFPTPSAMAYPRHSPLKKLFDMQILMLKETGVTDKWLSKWAAKPMICVEPTNNPRLHLDNLKAVLVVCTVGVLFATIVLLVECCIWKNAKSSY